MRPVAGCVGPVNSPVVYDVRGTHGRMIVFFAGCKAVVSGTELKFRRQQVHPKCFKLHDITSRTQQ